MNSDRLPFEWGNLWRIFRASLDEFSFGEMLWRMPLVMAIAYASGYEMVEKNMLKPADPYALMVWTYYGVSWPLFVVFRYYFLPSYWFPWMQVAAGLLYGGILGILIALFYHASLEQTVTVVACGAISILILTGRRE